MRLGQLGRDEYLERELTSFERELTREPRATASRASSLGGPVEAGRGGGTPAGVTPAGVTPGGLTRTSSFGRHIQRRTASFGRATGVRRAPSVARAASAGSFVEPSYPGSSRERSTRYRDLDSRSRDLELELERQFSQMMGSDEIETRGEAISRDQTASLSSSFSSQPAASVRPAATREVKCLNPPPPTPPRPFGRICSHRVLPMEPHAPPTFPSHVLGPSRCPSPSPSSPLSAALSASRVHVLRVRVLRVRVLRASPRVGASPRASPMGTRSVR